MKKNLTEIVFILDKSGSMSGLEADTIGGFNSMLEEQREGAGEVILSTVLFDNKTSVLHDRVDIKSVRKLTRNDYKVGGCTALLDALGSSIRHIERMQRLMPKSIRPEKTMFVITTDGMENSSHRYSYSNVKQMVEQMREKYNWEFIFLGANMDAINVAADIGIRADRATNYHCDAHGTELNYRVLSRAVTSYRACACAADNDEALRGWDDEIAEDFKSR